MNIRTLLSALAACVLITYPAAALTQGALPAGAEVQEPPPLPTTLEQAIELEPPQVVAGLDGSSAEELQRHLTAWIELLRQQQEALESALSRVEGSPLRGSAVVRLAADRDRLVAGVEGIAGLYYEGGGHDAEARALIEDLHRQDLEHGAELFTVPVSSFQAREVGVDVLTAALRPLDREQVGGQLGGWMELLQRNCLAVRNAEVAALSADAAEEVELYSRRAVVLRGERSRLIERVNVVIESFEMKGGDAAEARAFVESVVDVPPVAGWRAALSTARAWTVDRDGGLALALKLGQAFGLLAGAWIVGRLLALLTKRALHSTRTSQLLREFAVVSVRRLALCLGALVAIAQMGVDMGPMLASIGAAGLVIGLALQGTLSNVASGLMIMINRPFDVGDIVSAGGVDGFVRGMTMVTTRIVTWDNQTIFVPNNKVWGEVIKNSTANETRRVDMVFGIAYADDIHRAKELLSSILAEHPKVLADPEPNVRVHEFADSSVNLICRPWTKAEDYWGVYWDVTETVKDRFDSEGISIPFPQRDVHVHGADALPAGQA